LFLFSLTIATFMACSDRSGGSTNSESSSEGATTEGATTEGATTGTTVNCAALVTESKATIAAVVAEHRSCEKHSECIMTGTNTACFSGCGAVVSKAYEDQVQAAVASANAFCVESGYAEQCGTPEPVLCEQTNPGCLDGVCSPDLMEPCPSSTFPTHPEDGQCAQATCNTMSNAVSKLILEAVQDANACEEDTDCVVVSTDTGCRGECGAAVNAASTAVVSDAIAWIDEQICSAHDFATECGFSTPDCAVPVPGCVDKQCVYSK
jgi:hypothetical protein